MNNITITEEIFNTRLLKVGKAVHIKRYMYNDTNHLIFDEDCLITSISPTELKYCYIEDDGNVDTINIIPINKIINGYCEITLLEGDTNS